MSGVNSSPDVLRIRPHEYVHILNNNTNVTRVIVGPTTYTRRDHEQIVQAATKMVLVPPRCYVTIQNPVVRDNKGEVECDEHGQAVIRHGDEEIRFENPEPFALYPGEKVHGRVSPLQVVGVNQALRLRCIRDFTEVEGELPAGARCAPGASAVAATTTTTTAASAASAAAADKKKAPAKKTIAHHAGDEWLFPGPATYWPRVQVQVAEVIRAVVVKPNQALKLRARKACVDKAGKKRLAGEEWLHEASGAYMPGVDESVVTTINAFVLTEKKALHLQATRTFTDRKGVARKAGEEWLVTIADASTHIPDVYETVVGEVAITVLSNRQFAVVVDPYDAKAKKNRLGQKELRKGECSFFLLPGERLENGIQSVFVLGEEEALLLRAREACVDAKDAGGASHEPGDRWMVYGPSDYIPPVEVEVLEKRRAIPLDVNEGVYVRDVRSGQVTMITGRSYMLSPNEELWEKELPSVVEKLLEKESESGGPRDKTRVVTYRAPHNTAVQIYDYKNKASRVVLGPELVLLGPDEQFTVLSLSGDKPKRPHVIKALALFLGPDFFTDIIVVETSDHARLSLKLSYNWHFNLDPSKPQVAFAVPDFVGDACKAIASRVRGAVAQTTFDQFHKLSASVIRKAVFGTTDDGRTRNRLTFSANALNISNIDIQSVEPVDQRTRDALQKSVQLAIEITTQSQEAAARHEAERLEQEAKGKLERQRILDSAEAEKAKTTLLQLVAASASVEAQGAATAEAQARAEASHIESEANLKMAELRAQAQQVLHQAELAQLVARQGAEVELQTKRNKMDIEKARKLADIETMRTVNTIDALGKETIVSIARAGPEAEAKLLGGLGITSVLITDSNQPVNLIDTCKGLIQRPQ